MNVKKSLKSIFLLFIVWSLFFIVVSGLVDFREAVDAVMKADFLFFLLSLFFFVSALLCSFLVWYVVLRSMGSEVSFKNLTEIILAGFFIDSILPNLTPAGEISMAYCLHKKEKVPLANSFVTIMLYSVGWFVAFIFLSIISLVSLLSFKIIGIEFALIMALMLFFFVLVLLMVVYFVIRPKTAERFLTSLVVLSFRLLRHTRFACYEESILKHTQKNLHSFSYVFRMQRKKKRMAAFSSILLILNHLLVATSFYCVVVMFGVKIPFLYILALFILIKMVSLISMVPGEMGIYELVSVPLLSLNAGIVGGVLITTVVRLIHYWSIVFIGGFFAVKLGFQIRTGEIKASKECD